jgi:hypothetical protein
MSIKLNQLNTTRVFNTSNGFIVETGAGGKRVLQPDVLNLILPNNAAAHNSVYRGRFLGTSVSAAAYVAIQNGTFDPEDTGGLFPGDYWTIGGVNWRIGALDFWLNYGDSACTKHHALIVPDTNLYNAQMHKTNSGGYEAGSANTTAGGFMATDMYLTGLNQAKTKVIDCFGAGHILTHREYLTNAATNGYATGGTWVDSTVELMTEEMVYGTVEFKNCENAANWPISYTIDHGQLPLFAYDRSRICNRGDWWLRDVASATSFALVDYDGPCDASNATTALGVRPAFGICAA